MYTKQYGLKVHTGNTKTHVHIVKTKLIQLLEHHILEKLDRIIVTPAAQQIQSVNNHRMLVYQHHNHQNQDTLFYTYAIF
jgi:uncharacterized protein YqgQ